jgi:hypothetical protein
MAQVVELKQLNNVSVHSDPFPHPEPRGPTPPADGGGGGASPEFEKTKKLVRKIKTLVGPVKQNQASPRFRVGWRRLGFGLAFVQNPLCRLVPPRNRLSQSIQCTSSSLIIVQQGETCSSGCITSTREEPGQRRRVIAHLAYTLNNIR